MTDVKQLVADAVKQQWEAFEADHPHLAAAIDQMQLIDGAVAELADDPDYVRVLGEAEALGTATQEVGNFVRDYVAKWIKRLV